MGSLLLLLGSIIIIVAVIRGIVYDEPVSILIPYILGSILMIIGLAWPLGWL